ncbi:MAG: PAS domain-containing protein [Anaerolineae bacterium]|nr:PAS domain-containing protein [Anaerolineae bacterium]
MTSFFKLMSSPPYLELPYGWIGWLGFLALSVGSIYLLVRWHKYNRPIDTKRILTFLILLVFVPITSLFVGVRLQFGEMIAQPGLPMDPIFPVVMLLAAVPWALAAGLLGPLSAFGLAFFSGLLIGMWHTHLLFTSLEYGLLAILFSACVRQRYRTTFFKLARHPIFAGLLISALYLIIHLVVVLFTSQGIFVTRLDYGLQSLAVNVLAVGLQIFIASLPAEAIRFTSAERWFEPGALEPSPAERSLQTRFAVSMAPLALILLLTLMIGNWIVAGEAAREMIHGQMSNAAEMSAQSVPFFLETGQNLILKLAQEPNLLSDNSILLSETLAEDIKTVPFFNQLSVLGEDSRIISSYPTANNIGPQSPVDEQMGIQFALDGMPFQYYSIPPVEGQKTAQISFLAAIFDQNGNAQRVLIGRADLETNPFSKPIISGLQELTGEDDTGMLLDENNRILVHRDPAMVMTTYTGRTSDSPLFYVDTGPGGNRVMVYFQPAEGRDWSIVLMAPVYRAQELALQIATPLLAMILVLSLVGLVILRFGLRMVTVSLKTLSQEAGRIAQGKLDQPLAAEGVDEVGQLRRSFETMRVSLKGRLDELNRLLLVSQGVASSLEFSEAVQPILEAALATGASAARVVLAPDIVHDQDGTPSMPMTYGLGPSQNLYRDLDEQILALTRQQDRLVLSNLQRPRLLNVTPSAPHPESLMAVALRHENLYYGTLWVAYDQPHTFSEEEVRFMVTLGGQAALAAANARLFLSAEIGRQRLESILASSPDPVLVTDQSDQLLLANPAAWQVLGLNLDESNTGKPINQVIDEPELINLLRTTSAEKQSVEVSLPGGRVFLATATPVLAEGQRMGRVCVLRDVTHFKELDALKSDFVSTVSHDLRSPLTLMRGYATMLEMVGQLNEQQDNYVRKIISGVESMARLVNNLLDLGRIESGVGLQVETINIRDVVERVVGSLQLQAAQRRIQLTSEFPAGSQPLIEADQALLQQALHNLVENAIKYTRPEGKVHVRTRIQPIGVVFEVIDNGTGISPVDQPRLFEKFYRGVPQGSKEQRGTGLGLAIVKSIAERHGGKVWAESQLGKGSTFYLAIPIQQGIQEVKI